MNTVEIWLTLKLVLGGLIFWIIFSSDYTFSQKIYSPDLKHQEPLVADIVVTGLFKQRIQFQRN